MQSEKTDKIAPALVAAQAEMPAIVLDRVVTVTPRNSAPYSYKYATLSNVMRTIQPTLENHGLCVVHIPTVVPSVKTRILHNSGQWFECEVPIGQVAGAQALGSEITYKRRYGVSAILGLVTEDDDDAQGADFTGGTREGPSAAPQSPQTENRPEGTGGEWRPPGPAKWDMRCCVCGEAILEGEECQWNGQAKGLAMNRHVGGTCAPRTVDADDIKAAVQETFGGDDIPFEQDWRGGPK